jgi:hypothetical protein
MERSRPKCRWINNMRTLPGRTSPDQQRRDLQQSEPRVVFCRGVELNRQGSLSPEDGQQRKVRIFEHVWKRRVAYGQRLLNRLRQQEN